MNIVCVICSDLLIPTDDVFHTPCGHIFHFLCLTQWLERSKTCPQCREKTTDSRIHRIYFNFSNSDSITEDASSLQDRIDKLKFQILVKDKEIKQFSDKSASLEKQVVGLRKEVKTVESELREKHSAIHALKEQAKYYKQQCSEIESAKQEISRLKKRVEEYKNMQTLLDAPAEDVDDMISRTTDPNTLITYISVMKREMVTSLNKRRELRSKLRALQQDLTKVSMERNYLLEEQNKRKKLEEDLLKIESEKLALHNEITKLKKQISSHKYNDSDKIKELDIHENEERTTEHVSPNTVTKKSRSEIPKITDNRVFSPVPVKENGENSPYLPVKSQGVFALHGQVVKRKPVMNLGSSILSKKPRIEQTATNSGSSSTMTYNGLGGHSKYDRFPNPLSGDKLKKPKSDSNMLKKSKSDVGRNQKLSDFVTVSDRDDTLEALLDL